MADQVIPGNVLTFIIRNDAPFVHMQEPVSLRTVRVMLTQAQQEAIACRCTGSSMGNPTFEDVSQVILEPFAVDPKGPGGDYWNRENFERWASATGHGDLSRGSHGDYLDPFVYNMYLAWCARSESLA